MSTTGLVVCRGYSADSRMALASTSSRLRSTLLRVSTKPAVPPVSLTKLPALGGLMSSLNVVAPNDRVTGALSVEESTGVSAPGDDS